MGTSLIKTIDEDCKRNSVSSLGWRKLALQSHLLLSLFFSLLGHAEEIKVRADPWCPFNCTPNSSKPGYMIEILQQTLGQKGYKVDYQEMNWARAITETRVGNVDAVVGIKKNEASDFIFTEIALGKSVDCFYTLSKSQWQYTGLAALDSVTVGVVKDYAYDEGELDVYINTHRKNTKRLDIITGDNILARNISKLQAERITALVESEPVVDHFIVSSKNPIQLRKAGCLQESTIYAAFSPVQPQSKKYAQIVSEGVKELRKNGQLKKILNRYGLKDNF